MALDTPVTILGIDPGSRITGFGVIRVEHGKTTYITSGCIKITDGTIPERLKQIHYDLSEIIEQYQPDEAAIEEVFVSTNLSSALKLGQARGAAITTIVQHDISVAEYTARQI
ncbi:MAG: crossover junction endodeoxyribonuclease RuvC, partial [Gammaproteobacteria bacterium]|nr:crossover junction endodeoxyribonuclease RuvC [Gammaproteobacteria bacterium]